MSKASWGVMIALSVLCTIVSEAEDTQPYDTIYFLFSVTLIVFIAALYILTHKDT